MDNETLDISVIIPVFNTASFLKKCLNSVVNQKYRFSKIILIDDGSTDGSGDICDSYLKAYNNIQVYHRQNAGAGAARNFGVQHVISDWLVFLDSDDFLDEDYSEIIASELDNTCDLILFDGSKLIEEGVKDVSPVYTRHKVNKKNISGIDYFAECIKQGQMLVQPGLAVYKKSLIEKISFPQNVIFEDEYFSLLALINAQRIKVLPYALYHRRIRPGSVITTEYDRKKLRDWCLVATEIVNYLFSNELIYSEKKEAICSYLIRNCLIGHFYYDEAKKTGELGLKEEQTYSSFVKSSCECICDYTKALADIDLSDSNKKYGIYGTGKHTIGFLKMYKLVRETASSKLEFYVTCPKENEQFDGDVVKSIEELSEDLDYIIISSYEHRVAMLEKCKTTEVDVPILDIYESIAVDVFSWFADFD